jgi:hypothetical protein
MSVSSPQNTILIIFHYGRLANRSNPDLPFVLFRSCFLPRCPRARPHHGRHVCWGCCRPTSCRGRQWGPSSRRSRTARRGPRAQVPRAGERHLGARAEERPAASKPCRRPSLWARPAPWPRPTSWPRRTSTASSRTDRRIDNCVIARCYSYVCTNACSKSTFCRQVCQCSRLRG